MKPSTSIWDIVWDKVIDGVFIFLGVYVAFFFNQWQEDRVLTKELKYNLSQIMRSLPHEDAKEKIPPLRIKQSRDEKGICSIVSVVMSMNEDLGKRYLNTIIQRGLSRYMPEEQRFILGLLSTYFESTVMQSRETSKQYYQKFNNMFSMKPDDYCYSEEELRVIEKKLSRSYFRHRLKENISQSIGFRAFSELKKMGIQLPPKRSLELNYNYSMEDDPHTEEQRTNELKTK